MTTTKKVAVIIKHPMRDFDWRVDVYELPEGATHEDVYKHVDSKMLGPFEIMAITERLSLDCKMSA